MSTTPIDLDALDAYYRDWQNWATLPADRVGPDVLALIDELGRLRDRASAVRALHRAGTRLDGGDRLFCLGCVSGMTTPWPCKTICAVEGIPWGSAASIAERALMAASLDEPSDGHV